MEPTPLQPPTQVHHAPPMDVPAVLPDDYPSQAGLRPSSAMLITWGWLGLFLITIAVLVFVHLWMLDSVPRGLYVDESSIGLNAATIAENLHDEHGHFLPVYFEAFGEYKNPIYIYSAAALFKIFGVSVWLLHFTSFLWLVAFVAGLAALTWRMFKGNKLVLWFAIVAGSMLPWIFPISRISFELIAQPAFWIWALYCIYRGYQEQMGKRWWVWPMLAGLLAGLSVYAYSTGRLLTFGLVATVLLVYFRRIYWKRHLIFLISTAVAFIPYAVYSLLHPGALTARFALVSFVDDANLSLIDKAVKLIINYFSYLSPMFLLFNGDPNTRHHIGLNGEVYVSVLVLAILGIAWLLRRKPQGLRVFGWLVLLNLIGAPMAAALTEPYHSLRTLLMAVYILIFAVFGLAYLTRVKSMWVRRVAIGLTIGLLVLESVSYAHYYFNVYPAETVGAFESYDFGHALQLAVNQQPSNIIVSSHANVPYAHLEFYKRTIQNPYLTPMEIGEPVAAPNTCIIYFLGDQTIINESQYPISLTDDTNYTKLKCFK